MKCKSQLKSIYVSKLDNATLHEQSETTDDGYTQEIDIVKILTNQLDVDFEVPNYNVRIKIGLGINIPLMNEATSTYFPQPLQNQWVFRNESIRIAKQSIESEKNNIYLLTIDYRPLKRANGNQLDFETVKVKRWKVAKFQEVGVENRVRFLANYNIDDDQLVGNRLLLLLDFYQHPLVMQNFISSFSKHNVIVPYIPDIQNFAASFEQTRQLDDVTSILDQLLSVLHFVDAQFQILAHGTAAMLALRVNELHCGKSNLMMCSPVLNYDFIAPSKMALRVGRPLKPRVPSKLQQNAELSAVSEDEQTVLQAMESIKQFNAKEEVSEIPEILVVKRRFSVQIKQKAPVRCENCECREQDFKCCAGSHKQVTMARVHSQYEELKNLNPEYQNHLVTNRQLREYRSQHNVNSYLTDHSLSAFAIEIAQIAQSVTLINDVISYIYYEKPRFVEKLTYLLQQSRAGQLKIISSVLEFGKIYSPLVPIAMQRNKFFSFLYGVMVLSPLSHINCYSMNKAFYDKSYFVALKYIDWFVKDQISINLNQNIIILVGTHDCFLNKQQLETFLFIQENYNPAKVQIKSLYGAGHEMFIHGSTIIQRMLESFQ